MCGIGGFVGKKYAIPIVLKCIKTLEYRGYDSWGICGIAEPGVLQYCKDYRGERDFEWFEKQVQQVDWHGTVNAIGHNRWATTGVPNQLNAHPHFDCSGKMAIVHNGIVENYGELKEFMLSRGHVISSETDTELIVHLIEENLKECQDIREAVLRTVRELQGANAFVLVHADYPTLQIGARYGSPLIYAKIGPEDFMISSSPLTIIEYTKEFHDLEDRQVVFIEHGKAEVVSYDGERQVSHPQVYEGTLEELTHDGFPHFMLKEIHEQVEKLRVCVAGRVRRDEPDVYLGGLIDHMPTLLAAEQVFFIGSGTSYRAALIGEWMFKNFLNIRARALQASEVASHNHLAGSDPKRTVCFCISQSGETRDLTVAMREMERAGVQCFGIVNVVGSKVARMTKKGVYLRVGPEIGVASTKAFTATIMVEAMITLMLARAKSCISRDDAIRFANSILDVPDAVAHVLTQEQHIANLAGQLVHKSSIMVLGRGYHQATMLEGALKMEEVAVIAALAELAGEMKHGPIAIITKEYPVVVLATDDSQRADIFNNIDEIKARGAFVIGICTQNDKGMIEHVHEAIIIPGLPPHLATIPAAVVMQLFAYYLGVLRGYNVDKPPNLAKSVTVG